MRTSVGYDEYLAQETISATKHEYLRGQVFAMAGGTPEHARLQASMARELGVALGGSRCAVFSSGLRVRVVDTGLSTYPDVTVVCGKLETAPDDPQAAVNPTVLVEILSEGTEAYDRGEKFAHYRRVPSLREYVLVSQNQPRIEVFRRADGGEWTFSELGAGDSLRLGSLNVAVSLDAIFANPLG
jgi:Uma2 family endonuclease